MAINIKELLSEIRKNWGKNKLLLWILGLGGVLLLILPGSCQPRKTPVIETVNNQRNYQQQLQKELEDILSGIQGAGQVKVMLTLEDEQEVVYAYNEQTSHGTTSEEDTQGGTREQVQIDKSGQLVIIRSSDQEQPLVVKVIKPKVRGVLVVAEGGDNPLICQRLTHAIQSVLDISAYRITIQKGR